MLHFIRVIFYSNFRISLLAHIIIYFIYTGNIHEKFKRKIRSQMSATYVAFKCAKCFVFSHVNDAVYFQNFLKYCIKYSIYEK